MPGFEFYVVTCSYSIAARSYALLCARIDLIIARLAGGRHSKLGTPPDTITWLTISMQTIRRTFSLWSSWC